MVLLPDEPEPMDVSSPLQVKEATEGSAVIEDEAQVKTVDTVAGSRSEVKAPSNKDDKVLLPDEPQAVDVTSPFLVKKATVGSAVIEDEAEVKTVDSVAGSGSEVKEPSNKDDKVLLPDEPQAVDVTSPFLVKKAMVGSAVIEDEAEVKTVASVAGSGSEVKEPSNKDDKVLLPDEPQPVDVSSPFLVKEATMGIAVIEDEAEVKTVNTVAGSGSEVKAPSNKDDTVLLPDEPELVNVSSHFQVEGATERSAVIEDEAKGKIVDTVAESGSEVSAPSIKDDTVFTPDERKPVDVSSPSQVKEATEGSTVIEDEANVKTVDTFAGSGSEVEAASSQDDKVLLPDEPEPMDVSSPFQVQEATEGSAVIEDEAPVKNVDPVASGSGSEVKAPSNKDDEVLLTDEPEPMDVSSPFQVKEETEASAVFEDEAEVKTVDTVAESGSEFKAPSNKDDEVLLPDEPEPVNANSPSQVKEATEGSVMTEDESNVKIVDADAGSGGEYKAQSNKDNKVLPPDEPEPVDVSSPFQVKEAAEGSAVIEEEAKVKIEDTVAEIYSEVKAPISVQTKRKGHRKRKRKRHRKQDDTDEGEKILKKGKKVSAVATSGPPPEVSMVAPTAVAVSTRKITFKTRPKTPPSTPPEAARKTAPKTPPKAPPKSMVKSTTPKSTTPRGGRGRKDDDGYAYFCALCHEFGELLCCEKCKQAFHLACLGLDRLPDADPWMCDNCVENKVECFDCKEFTALEEDVLLCSYKNCSKFFHEECSKKWDRWDKAQLGKTSATKKPPGFICPHHICDACGNTRTPKRSRLYRCLYCPVAYHENCAPDGTQFLEDVPGFMSCWKHDDDWKQEIQTGEQIRDLKTFFQQLPLPGVSNDFQVPHFIHEAVKKLNRKPSTYTHIRRNIYLAKKPRRRSEDEGMQCSCRASDSSKSACEKDCLCGMLLTSCSSSCGCGKSCQNVPFQKRPGQKLKAVKTQNCGWGLRADVDIRAGEFLVEYVGEVIDDKTCEERLWALKKQGETNFYMCEISREMVIDATFKGNLSRYINHSCEPNSELQKWNIEGEVRIGVFAISDIKKGSFITYDYQFVQFGTDQQCHCGSTDCRGQLGVRSHRAKDVSISPLRSRPSNGSKFFEHNNSDTIGRAFRHRRDQCADSAGTKDLQFVRYNSAEARKWVGHRVAVWWPLDQKYYRGQIVSYNVNSKKHVITYDDGDLEDLNMSKETWLLENVPCSQVQVASKA